MGNRPYKVLIAQGDWTCSVARFTGIATGPMKGPDRQGDSANRQVIRGGLLHGPRWDQNGQIIEENLFYDLVSFMQQIGIGG